MTTCETKVLRQIAALNTEGHLCGASQMARDALEKSANLPVDGHNSHIPIQCNSCGKPLLMENLFVDDGCPCNSPRGGNFTPQPCALCELDCCVKPGH